MRRELDNQKRSARHLPENKLLCERIRAARGELEIDMRIATIDALMYGSSDIFHYSHEFLSDKVVTLCIRQLVALDNYRLMNVFADPGIQCASYLCTYISEVVCRTRDTQDARKVPMKLFRMFNVDQLGFLCSNTRFTAEQFEYLYNIQRDIAIRFTLSAFHPYFFPEEQVVGALPQLPLDINLSLLESGSKLIVTAENARFFTRELYDQTLGRWFGKVITKKPDWLLPYYALDDRVEIDPSSHRELGRTLISRYIIYMSDDVIDYLMNRCADPHIYWVRNVRKIHSNSRRVLEKVARIVKVNIPRTDMVDEGWDKLLDKFSAKSGKK
jgi:hypothetical protein